MQEGIIELLVIGGGIAGLTAANRAAQLGKSVTLLEKGQAEKYPCNSRFSGGTFSICFKEIMSGTDILVDAIMERTKGYADTSLARAIAEDAPNAIRWLQAEGAKFIKTNTEPHLAYKTWVLAPPPRVMPGLNWQGRGPDFLLTSLTNNLMSRGGQIQRGARAHSMTLEADGQISVGVTTDAGETVLRSRAVVIADGGFQANIELLRGNVSPAPEKLRQRGAATGMGDGLKMVQSVGGALVGLDCFYGHPLSVDALTNDKLWPYPYLDVLTTAGIVVNAEGRRFANEGVSGVYVANAIARLADPLSAFVVYDETIWNGPGRAALIAPNPFLKETGGTIHQAASVEELAGKMGVPAAALVESVSSYNAAHRQGRLAELDPPRMVERYKPLPIETAPFYAAPLCAGITYTMGGIATDAHCRVLTPEGKVIPGLYAAGATTGGLEGGPSVGYVGGLTKSSVMGYRAASHFASLP